MLRSSLLPLALAAVLQAGEAPHVRRDGQFWVLTTSGAEAVAPRAPVRVLSRGGVKAEGGSQRELLWRLTLRLKARNEEQALALLKQMRVRTARQGEALTLVAEHGEGFAHLEIRAPAGISAFDIVTAGGSVEVESFQNNVGVRSGGGRVRLDRIGGQVAVRTGGGNVTLGRVEGGARCTTGGGVIRAEYVGGPSVMETGGGEIHVVEAAGSVRASTAGGGVRVQKAHAGVYANTAGGPIEIRSAGGLVEARNAGGPIEIGAANGVRCETAGGAIRLQNVFGSLRASTAAGSILAQLPGGKPLADSVLSTGSGDITLFIPSNVGVRIQARNGAADSVRRIISEFSGVQVQLVGSSVVAEGEINGGGPLLRIAGNNGTIFIKRLD